eukprot:scaffold123539_cov35-Prasinocladus_malaysianus.AAC.1
MNGGVSAPYPAAVVNGDALAIIQLDDLADLRFAAIFHVGPDLGANLRQHLDSATHNVYNCLGVEIAKPGHAPA